MFQPRPTKVMVGVIMRDIAGFFKKSDAPKTLHDLVCHAYLRDQYPHLHCGRLGKFANAMDETVFRWLEPHEESVLPKKVVAQVIALHEQLASHQ
ncbi:MAG: hypothetical protein KBD21_04525 [Candidatus Pacebacteria bacterium]|nr:hypothetical protein [Candidatus Paceibacterota bacterium]